MNEFITSKVVDAQIKLAEAKNEDTGATAVEYGIMVAAIAAVIVAVVVFLGKDVLAGFTTVETSIDGVTNG